MKRLLILLFVETMATIAFALPSGLEQKDSGDYLYASSKTDADYITTRYKGTIDDEPVILTIRDLEDSIDEEGTMWAYSGQLTYTASGETLRINGYARRQYLFLDMYDNERKSAGHFELEDNGEGFQGTFSAPSGKESPVMFIEEQ